MLEQARAMMKIARLIETLDADQQYAVAYEVYRNYGGPSVDDAEMLLAQRRTSDRERQLRARGSRDMAPGESRDKAETSRDGEGDTDPSSSTSSFLESSNAHVRARVKQQHVLTPPEEAKAKVLLPPSEFDFLLACPEPFRTQWLLDPGWWVSLRDGYPKVDALRETSKCMSYVQGKFSRKQIAQLNLRERLRRWIAKADAWRENGEERKAVRR